MRSLGASFCIALCALLPLCCIPATAIAQTINRYIVMRVDFQDSGTTSPRYSRQQVEQQLANVTDLFLQNSNGTMKAEFVVTDIFRLPKSKAAYSSTSSMETALLDALSSAPPTVTALWANDVHAIVVVLSQKWDPGGSYYATRNVGSNGSPIWVGNAVVGENPGDTDRQVWGRWAHEVGHNLQSGAAAADTPLQVAIGGHPSGYNSDFDLMDSNYPGRIGAVSIQLDNQFRNAVSISPRIHQPWLSLAKYQTFTRALGGGNAAIWAIEYDQSTQPNVQAVKVELAPHVYYMVSVRRRVRGDDLNDTRTPQGIPDEGVLIERVDEVTSPQAISTVIGRNRGPTCSTASGGCNRGELWKEGDTFRAPNEVTIEITRKVDDDNYLIRVIYSDVGAQPDVMIKPWVSPPGNTWETTDIWVDSPVNGFGVFRYGMWDDGTGQMVPIGNGDDPAVGLTNRVYARIRNVGNVVAPNVVATFEVTDPLGMGITGPAGWVGIGTANATTFPQLASIPAGGTADVYVDWKPTFTLTPAQLASGVFYFHSCLRLRLNALPGETVLANQDGDREQENISYFQVPPKGTKSHKQSVSLQNDDLTQSEDIILGYRLTGPQNAPNDWQVVLNNGVTDVTLAPGELREIPVEIIRGASADPPGQRYSVDVFGLSHHELVNDLDQKDLHNEFRYTGGARIDALIVVPTNLRCRASVASPGLVSVVGRLGFSERLETPRGRLKIMAVGWNSERGYLESNRVLMTPNQSGEFGGWIEENGEDTIERVDCMFSGTTEVSSAWQSIPLARTK